METRGANWETFVASGNFWLGVFYTRMEEYQKAIDCFNDTLNIVKKINFSPSWSYEVIIGLEYGTIKNNDKNINLERLYALGTDNRRQIIAGFRKRTIGEVLINLDEQHLPEAEQWFLQAIKTDKENGMRFELGMDHVAYADWFKRKGDKQGAKEKLGEAVDILTECGADGWVEKYKKELAALS